MPATTGTSQPGRRPVLLTCPRKLGTVAESGRERRLTPDREQARRLPCARPSEASGPSCIPLSPSPPPPAPRLEARNLFGEAERIAARAATPSTRRQYGAIFHAFGDWLAAELGRPPVVRDLDADVIAAYGRHLATSGGRGGPRRRRRPCACICR